MIKITEDLLAPEGVLGLQIPATAEATNLFGDVYSGWVIAKAILAAEMHAARLAGGRVATVSSGGAEFMSPVLLGTVLSFYSRVTEVGNSSVRLQIEVWGRCPDGAELRKVTEITCVQVAIDDNGHIRPLPSRTCRAEPAPTKSQDKVSSLAIETISHLLPSKSKLT